MKKIHILIGALTIVLVLLTLESPVIAVGALFLAAFGFLIVRNSRVAVMLIIGSKPIIDATWDLRIPGIGLNLLQIIGVAFPLITFLIIYVNHIPIRNYKNIRLFLLFIILNVISYLVFIINTGLTKGGNVFIYFVAYIAPFFQFLNSVAAYIIIPYLFQNEKDRKRFFFVLIIASLFPLLTGYFQYFGFIGGRLLRTSGDLIRLSGFYYDSSNLRMYSLQAIIVLIIYLGDFLKRTNKNYLLQRTLYLLMIPLFLFIVYKGYSKAALGIVMSWVLIYSISRRRFMEGVFALTLIFGLYLFNNRVADEIDRLFNKEISYSEGTLNPANDYTLLGGRVKTWRFYLTDFMERDFSEQIIGYYFSVGGTVHNDFFRILLTNGYLGLLVYILFLISLSLSLIKSYLTFNDNLSLASIMLFAALIIDSLGLVPLLYPGYCWITFGVISLSLHRNLYTSNVVLKPNESS